MWKRSTERLENMKCEHCKDKETNYNCPCWYEGWLMGEAEYEYNHPKQEIKVDFSTTAGNSIKEVRFN